jgi:hypothetical protein
MIDSEVIKVLERIGFESMLYFSHVFNNMYAFRNEPLYNFNCEDYCHCMYTQNFFYWLFSIDDKPLSIEQSGSISILYTTDTGMRLSEFIYNINILHNKVYNISFHFDNICHYFTVVTTEKSLIIFNTSQDTPGKLIIKIHPFNLGVSLLINVLSGYNKFYYELFGFEYPRKSVSDIETIRYMSQDFYGSSLDNLRSKLYIILNNLKYQIDKDNLRTLINSF